MKPDPKTFAAYPDAFELIPLFRCDAVSVHKGRQRKDGKRPLHFNWTKRAYARDAVLKLARKGHNVGVRLTARQLVIDIDPRNGGDKGFAHLCRALKLDPIAWPCVITGSGGRHYYLTLPKSVRVSDTLEAYPGVEFKSIGRQVVAAGSIHPDTLKPYESDFLAPSIEDGAPMAPARLIEAILRPHRTGEVTGGGQYDQEQIARALDRLDATDFADHDKWLRLMMACHHASNGDARQEWIDWCISDPKYADETDVIGRRWDSLHKEKTDGITYRTLNNILAEAGAADAQATPEVGEEEFGDIEEVSEDVEAPSGLTITAASDIKLERINWLWEGRIARGKLSIIGGLPNQGKTQVVINMAATVSTGGKWPNDEGRAERGGVIFISAEDDAADTLAPRLKAAGADLSRVHIVNSIVRVDGKARVLNLMDDLSALAAAVRERDVKMVAVDPLGAYLGGGKRGDVHKNADVRAMLTPVTEWAARLGVAVVAISHFNKSGNGTAIHRITDSQAFTAAARSVWLTTEEEGTGRMLFLEGKNNIAAKQPGLAYKIEGVDVGDGINAPRIVWDGTTTVTAQEALGGGERRQSALEAATAWLQEQLIDGPALEKEIKRRAQEAGISTATLNRAKGHLGVKSDRKGFQGKVHWKLGYEFADDDDFQ